jgi:hypothetical protein
MSKRSLFWGKASGKLGEAVFYRAGGTQRTRTYVKNVKNPKSYQQALQRTKFNNLVGCFKGISTAVKSFYTKRAPNAKPASAADCSPIQIFETPTAFPAVEPAGAVIVPSPTNSNLSICA